MAYPSVHRLITFLGTAWGDTETWSFGLRVDGSGAPSEGQLDELEAAARAFHSSGATKFHESSKLESIKVANIGTDGNYVPGDQAMWERILSPAGDSGGTQPTYPQICLCVSLVTAAARGPASRGRFYPPPTCHVVDASGRIAVASQNAYRDAAATFVSAINNAGMGSVSVFSKTHGVKRDVTGIRVGRVFDTQRRRRSSLAEEYSGAAVAPG